MCSLTSDLSTCWWKRERTREPLNTHAVHWLWREKTTFSFKLTNGISFINQLFPVLLLLPLRNLDIDKLSGNYVAFSHHCQSEISTKYSRCNYLHNSNNSTPLLLWLLNFVLINSISDALISVLHVENTADQTQGTLPSMSSSLPEYFTPHLGEYVSVLSALEKLNVAILRAMDKTKEVGDDGFPLCAVLNISTQRQQTYICFSSFQNIC